MVTNAEATSRCQNGASTEKLGARNTPEGQAAEQRCSDKSLASPIMRISPRDDQACTSSKRPEINRLVSYPVVQRERNMLQAQTATPKYEERIAAQVLAEGYGGPRLAGLWERNAATFNWTYRFRGWQNVEAEARARDGQELPRLPLWGDARVTKAHATIVHEFRGSGRCDFAGRGLIITYMRIPGQATLTALFEQRLLGIGVQGLVNYEICPLEDLPRRADCASKGKQNRCLVQAQLGWNAKQAFAHDLLVLMSDGAQLLFLDTDTAVLRPLSLLLDYSKRATADVVWAKAMPASTNLFVARRSRRTLRFFDIWRRLMDSDEQFKYGDQSWVDLMLLGCQRHLFGDEVRALRYAIFPTALVPFCRSSTYESTCGARSRAIRDGEAVVIHAVGAHAKEQRINSTTRMAFAARAKGITGVLTGRRLSAGLRQSSSPFSSPRGSPRASAAPPLIKSSRVVVRLHGWSSLFLRYFSVFEPAWAIEPPSAAGAGPSDRLWLLGRAGHVDHKVSGEGAYRTVILAANATSGAVIDAKPLVDDFSMSHNLVVRRHNASLYFFGGQSWLNNFFDGRRWLNVTAGELRDGVRMLVSPLSAFPREHEGSWSHLPRAERAARGSLLDGRHPGCTDRRRKTNFTCEFDGKLSVAVDGRGRWLLYARANLREVGGRWLQVAVSETGPHGPFGPFELVQIEGYPLRQQQSWPEIYFACVSTNPIDAPNLVAFFPLAASFAIAGYLAVAFSCDGVHFSRETPLLTSAAIRNRTIDQPVDGMVYRDGQLRLFVHRHVPKIAMGWQQQARIVEYTLDLEAFRAVSRAATSSLVGCATR